MNREVGQGLDRLWYVILEESSQLWALGLPSAISDNVFTHLRQLYERLELIYTPRDEVKVKTHWACAMKRTLQVKTAHRQEGSTVQDETGNTEAGRKKWRISVSALSASGSTKMMMLMMMCSKTLITHTRLLK